MEGYDEALADLGSDDQARHARAAIDVERDVDVYGFVTSGVTEIAIASTRASTSASR